MIHALRSEVASGAWKQRLTRVVSSAMAAAEHDHPDGVSRASASKRIAGSIQSFLLDTLLFVTRAARRKVAVPSTLSPRQKDRDAGLVTPPGEGPGTALRQGVAGAPLVYFFWLPRLPKLPNRSRGLHWAIIRDEKIWFAWYLRGEMAKLGWSNLPRAPFRRARVRLVRRSPVEPDHDNLAASMKPVQDALVTNGLVLDDKPSVISAEYAWEYARKSKDRGVLIELEGL